MPTLKDINCSIELPDSQRTLQEFGTTYGDGCVETFVSVPSKPQSFSIHLTSEKFIAPGISMYVFVDGVYQCNRNQQNLKLRKHSDSRSVVDFRVRQKEEKQKDGSMIAREWKFEKLDTSKSRVCSALVSTLTVIASADGAPDVCSSNVLDNLGCIEVLVLRCAGPRTAKPASAMNMDGASDFRPHHLGLDGQPRYPDGHSLYDDRGPYFDSHGGTKGRPPPSLYRPPYVESVQSHEPTEYSRRTSLLSKSDSPFPPSRHEVSHSRYSAPISPGARSPGSIPSAAVQYGSGPIPSAPMFGSERSFYHTRPSSVVATNAPGVDPSWLNDILTKAVKRGVEESRRDEPNLEINTQRVENFQRDRQPPGAWPRSPRTQSEHPVQQAAAPQHTRRVDVRQESNTAWGESQVDWGSERGWEKVKSQVKWSAEPKWNKADDWCMSEETQSDTWDTDENWTPKASKEQKASQWEKSRTSTAHSGFNSRSGSPLSVPTHQSRRSSRDRSRRTRSKSRPRSAKWTTEQRSSSEDREGWIHLGDSSSPSASWEESDNTLQPSRSRSKHYSSRDRSRSRKRSQHTQSTYSHSRQYPQHLRGGDGRPSSSWHHHAEPVTSGPAQTIMNAAHDLSQLPTYPPGHAPQVPSSGIHYTSPAPPSMPPQSTWASATPEVSRKQSSSTIQVPPPPFSVSEKSLKLDDQRRSTSSSSWDADKNESSKKHRKESSFRTAGWGSEEKTKKLKDSWGDETGEKSSWDTKEDDGWATEGTRDESKDSWVAAKEKAVEWDTGRKSWDIKSTSKIEKSAKKETTAWPTDEGNNNAAIAEADAWGTQESAWDATTTWPSAPPPAPAPAPAPTSKRHTSKSLSKYRSNPSTARKSHWQFPPPDTTTTTTTPSTSLPAEPLLKLTPSQASSKAISHQARAGPATQYGHVIGRPEYIDGLDKPYAVFRFKYRSRAILREAFGDEVPERGSLSTRIAGDKRKRKEERKVEMSKRELVQKMERLERRLEEQDKRLGTESGGRDKTAEWVRMHSRDASEKGREKRGGEERRDEVI
jgi:hypothetical protein